MGVDLHNLQFLAHAQDLGVRYDRTLAIGRQAVFVDQRELQTFRALRQLPALNVTPVPAGRPMYFEPLMQQWFSQANPGVSPYRLYALSNVGSLLALLSYPFYFERVFSRQTQANLWSGGLLVFVACCGYCAWRVRSGRGNEVGSSPQIEPGLLTSSATCVLPERQSDA